MTDKDNTDRTDRESYANLLRDEYVDSPPETRLDDLCGLDSPVEKARRTLVEPHHEGQHRPAAKTALVYARTGRKLPRLAAAIAGELGSGTFEFARLDFEQCLRHAQSLGNPDDLGNFLDAIVAAQPLVVVIENFVTAGRIAPDVIQQWCSRLSNSDDAIVVIGIDQQQERRYRGQHQFDHHVDVRFSIPAPGEERSREFLQSALVDQASATDLQLTENLQVEDYTSDIAGFDTRWLQQIARRAITLAADTDSDYVTEEQLQEAIEQIDDERPTESTHADGRTDEPETEFSAEVPDVTFDEIGGQGHAKKRLREILRVPASYGSLYEDSKLSPTKGVLLHGPPGTGKTMLAAAFANETDRSFYLVNGAEVKSMWFGQSEQRLQQVFEAAREDAPSLLFFDEIDALAGDRSGASHDGVKSIVATFLTELDGLGAEGDVLVIGATNRLEAVDPAIQRPKRLGETLEVGLPDQEDRREIFDIYLRDLPTAEAVTPEWAAAVTPDTVTGADIAAIVERALQASVDVEDTDISEDVVVEQTHVTAALDAVTGEKYTRRRGFE